MAALPPAKGRIVTHRIRIAALLAVCIVFAARAVPTAHAAAPEEPAVLSYAEVQAMVIANKGKVVVVNFFATWCPPCREEIPGLMRIRKSFGEDKLILVGASLDENKKTLAEYMKQTKFNYPIRMAGPDLVRAAGVSSIPHLLIYNGKGEAVANQAGLVSEKDLRDFLKKVME